ncbi:hypothetical protein F8388_020594 [Cannabis sativa]|uniref:Tyrosine-specific transport protein n=1 Tax=Cannabis sativa TaxID=3483 RepID=A0A7J6EPG1_CANSA|nr:hypothetical protein F8388_020594 [Cannabis sativa]
MTMAMALTSHSPPSLQIPSSIISLSSMSYSLSRKHIRFWEKSPFGSGGNEDHLTLLKLYCPKTTTHSHKFKCFSQDPSQSESQQLQFERLFSNLNQVTFKREPGRCWDPCTSCCDSRIRVSGLCHDMHFQLGLYGNATKTKLLLFLDIFPVANIFFRLIVENPSRNTIGKMKISIADKVVTGLLIAEVNVNTMCELGSGGVSLVSIDGHENSGESRSTSCLLVVHFHTLCSPCCLCLPFFKYFDKLSPYSTVHTMISLPSVDGSIMVADGKVQPCFLWSLEAYATLEANNSYQRFIGAINGVLVLGIMVSFGALVAVASGDLQWDALLKANFQAVPMSIPIIVLSFVYQNVVPVLCTDLEGNLSKIRTAIILGTTIPLILFLVWNAVILGTITNLELGADKMIDPLQQLQSSNGAVGPIVEAFSLLAIATSYIGFVLGLSDFLADLLKLPADRGSPVPYILTLFPPLALSLLDPDIFFKALDFAGTYGVLVLFGVVPAAMSWSDRYSSSSPSSMLLPQLVPGGKITLSIILGGAGYVIFSELLEKFGHP